MSTDSCEESSLRLIAKMHSEDQAIHTISGRGQLKCGSLIVIASEDGEDRPAITFGKPLRRRRYSRFTFSDIVSRLAHIIKFWRPTTRRFFFPDTGRGHRECRSSVADLAA